MIKADKEIVIKCVDNCSCLSIDYWDNPEEEYDNPEEEYDNPEEEYDNPEEEYDNPKQEYIISFYNSYSDRKSFIEKLKDIWKIIRGKRIYNSEVILSEEDFEKIQNFNK